VSLDDRRPRSLSELRELLLSLEPLERIKLLRSIPSAELEAVSTEPEECSGCLEWADPCGRPGQVRLCNGEVCSGCCDEHACVGATSVG
jgi:hypothetical protein